ncbi:MAG TPA: hypothetical protein VFW09_09375 [Solirubrobacteraceae bacterium]|nr:hypothetical protein [Solirubrobacteraceae bacterium]
MSALVEIAADQLQEEFFARGWTDGLPVVPPTPELVEAMLATVDREAQDVIGSIPSRSRSVTAEQAAVNAVMAGCRSDYFPVVVAALSALLDPSFNAHAALSSTGGAASCVIVSGPLAAEIGMNAGHNALGSGNRANATIGRAVRLVARNIFGAVTGRFDATAMGNPAKYTLCFAEEDPPAPWAALRVRLGYEPGDTTVTVMATEGPRQVANHLNEDPEGVLLTFVSAMRVAATFAVGKGGQGVVVMGPEHTKAVHQAGWSQERAQEFLCRESRIRPEELEGFGVPLEVGSQHDMSPGPDGRLPTVGSPADVYLVTAGGAGPGWSAYLPSFAPLQHTRAVTRRVRMLGEAMPDCGPDGCEVDLPSVPRRD